MRAHARFGGADVPDSHRGCAGKSTNAERQCWYGAVPACEPAWKRHCRCIWGRQPGFLPLPSGSVCCGGLYSESAASIGLLPCAPLDCAKKRRAGSPHITTFKGPVRVRTHAYGGCPCSSRTKPADVRCKLSVDFPRSVARSAQVRAGGTFRSSRRGHRRMLLIRGSDPASQRGRSRAESGRRTARQTL